MKKGISLATLIITIIIMTILLGVIALNINNIFIDKDVTFLKLDIFQLESLMKTYNARKSGNLGFQTTQFDTSDLEESELSQFAGETITNNEISLYVINLSEIDAKEVNFGNLEEGAKDRYLYSSTTGKVYYEKGLETKNGVLYYILDEN